MNAEIFNGVRIYTCANRTSGIGPNQYFAYCDKYGVSPAIWTVSSRSFKGIGGGKGKLE